MSWERIEGRLARVPFWGLLGSQAIPTVGAAVFLVGNLNADSPGWAIVWGILLALELALIGAWWVARRGFRSDRRERGGISRPTADR